MRAAKIEVILSILCTAAEGCRYMMSNRSAEGSHLPPSEPISSPGTGL